MMDKHARLLAMCRMGQAYVIVGDIVRVCLIAGDIVRGQRA